MKGGEASATGLGLIKPSIDQSQINLIHLQPKFVFSKINVAWSNPNLIGLNMQS